MTDSFVLKYIPKRLKQLGFKTAHIRYHDLLMQPGEQMVIQAYNDLYFIVDDPAGLVVESSYGIYDATDNALKVNAHQHRGEITITNPGAVNRRIKMIQVIIVN